MGVRHVVLDRALILLKRDRETDQAEEASSAAEF